MQEGTDDATGGAMIEVSGITKRFGLLDVLRPTDLVVHSGEFVSLVGASGSGKTTLLRIIAGLESPTTGSVRVAGRSATEARQHKQIALVPQSPALLPWRTVDQNVRLLLQLNTSGRAVATDDDRLDGLLAEVGLAKFADAYPHELSGGMQQRVALVRAFALDAPLLLLDEPFGALDEITRAEMRHLLARLCDQTQATVLFVTHSLSEAIYLSDRVGVLSDRPGTITSLQSIDLPRPRTPEMEDDPSFFEQLRTLRHELHAARAQSVAQADSDATAAKVVAPKVQR